MRVSKEHKKKVRREILDAASTGFREEGFNGLGVDGLAKRAGMTSGAFYGHFSSKGDAFQEVVTLGLQDYGQAVRQFQNEHGAAWAEKFLDYYLGKEHVDDLSHSCVVPGLSSDVVRAGEELKQIYEAEIGRISSLMSSASGGLAAEDAPAFLALLAGAVMMARSVSSGQMVKTILASARRQAEAMLVRK